MFEYVFMEKLKQIYPETQVLAHIENIKDFNGYELKKVFNLDVPQCTWKEAARYGDDYPENGKHYKTMSKLYKIRKYVMGEKPSFIKQDDYTSFYQEIYELNPLKSYYLMGVWANEAYIDGMDDVIRNSFIFPEGLSERNAEYMTQMKNTNSVCIHVRRNEYVTCGLTVVNDGYYINAVKYMKERLNNPSFFVFSDDHSYCKKLFDGLIDYTLVEGNTGGDSFRDLQLMTYCKNNIIANSTFSFWGAYLGEPNKDKIIITPTVSWGHFRHPFACKEWIKMDSN